MKLLYLLVLIVIIVIYLVFNKKYNISKRRKECNCRREREIAQKLVRQTARWSLAAVQDENPAIAVLHANYGAGYLWAIKDNFTPEEVREYTDIDFMELENDVVGIQDNSNRKLFASCSTLIPGEYKGLLKAAGEI